ncbi:MAG TPA: NAD-dependent epimerase/dehydratase family protein [Candidatus Babeliales bacterium]|nr:NAD-dependent epimerase/dehydratase family protein [Candidatus Babeliales bacterium]
MRVLVTGGAGFIGRHITEYFQHRAEVRVLDNLRSGLKSNLSGLNCQFMIGSILDRDLVAEAMKGVDFVFHLAAIASVQESIQKPNECAEINTRGTVIVLEEAARAGAKKLILSSSAAIYGDNPINPQVESMPPEPKSPYATSKYEAERHCHAFTDQGRLATVSLRYFNVFGPYQNPRSEYSAVVPAFVEKAIRNEPITIFGDGQQTRDFIYVDDVIAANAFFALKSQATGIFNVACGRTVTVTDLALTIRKLTNSSCTIDYSAERPGDVKHSVASIDKMHAAGVRPVCDLAGGLRATIEFFSKDIAGIERGRRL